MRAWSVLRQLLAATLCAALVAPAYPSESTLPRSSSTPSHTYDAETLSKTRVWGSSEKNLLHFRAMLLVSEKQHWGCENSSWKTVAGSGVTYDYDAFGNIVHSTGSTPNEFLFAGEQFDSDLGLYYNRARYLNTNSGRFLNGDPSEGSQEDPTTLHRYSYAADNPVTLVDHSGMDYISDPDTGGVVQQVIGQQFRIQFGSNGCIDAQIVAILASDCDASRIVGLPFPGGSRPDLANIQTGALFEIKPIKSAGSALLQLAGYKILLRLADGKGRNWHYGSAAEFTPNNKIFLSGGRVAYVAPPVLGVIVYYVADARDAFDLSLLLASRILSVILGSSEGAAAATAGSNVISITTGTGIAGAAAGAEAAEIGTEVGTAVTLAPAA